MRVWIYDYGYHETEGPFASLEVAQRELGLPTDLPVHVLENGLRQIAWGNGHLTECEVIE